MSVEIKWNRSPQQILDRILDDAAMTYAHTRLKAYCSQYVPMDEGAMDQGARPTPKYLEYPGPYAHFQWEGVVFVDERGSTYALPNHSKRPTNTPLHHSTDHHPLATSHWEVAAMAAHKGDLCRDIEAYLRRR